MLGNLHNVMTLACGHPVTPAQQDPSQTRPYSDCNRYKAQFVKSQGSCQCAATCRLADALIHASTSAGCWKQGAHTSGASTLSAAKAACPIMQSIDPPVTTLVFHGCDTRVGTLTLRTSPACRLCSCATRRRQVHNELWWHALCLTGVATTKRQQVLLARSSTLTSCCDAAGSRHIWHGICIPRRQFPLISNLA